MRAFTLKRLTDDRLSYPGVLLDENGQKICCTLENPWHDNQVNISCIPEGDYLCKRYGSQKFGNTFQIVGVPGRTGILFHKGNWSRDTEGCILLGTSFIYEPDKGKGVGNSSLAMTNFMHLMRDEQEFLLKVVNS